MSAAIENLMKQSVIHRQAVMIVHEGSIAVDDLSHRCDFGF